MPPRRRTTPVHPDGGHLEPEGRWETRAAGYLRGRTDRHIITAGPRTRRSWTRVHDSRHIIYDPIFPRRGSLARSRVHATTTTCHHLAHPATGSYTSPPITSQSPPLETVRLREAPATSTSSPQLTNVGFVDLRAPPSPLSNSFSLAPRPNKSPRSRVHGAMRPGDHDHDHVSPLPTMSQSPPLEIDCGRPYQGPRHYRAATNVVFVDSHPQHQTYYPRFLSLFVTLSHPICARGGSLPTLPVHAMTTAS
ncbi:hypothetical protein C0995_009922 [Termitomyces sp. Mi166|nr:hypothetical protein C0995_009922 [Termitomyces sp. Mi166\